MSGVDAWCYIDLQQRELVAEEILTNKELVSRLITTLFWIQEYMEEEKCEWSYHQNFGLGLDRTGQTKTKR